MKAPYLAKKTKSFFNPSGIGIKYPLFYAVYSDVSIGVMAEKKRVSI
jgi:hypothetical protein